MRGRGGRRQLQCVSLVDAISISNQMAKHKGAVSIFCRFQNVASVYKSAACVHSYKAEAVSVCFRVQNAPTACNAGGSSSLHTRMNAAARLMQLLRCAARHLKTSQCFLQHASHQGAGKHWHDKRSAQHSTRAAAAAPALSSRDPASHAPSPPQPSSMTRRSCAYRQAQCQWPVDGTRTPNRGA
jgi:hypothetical protein